MDILIPQRKVCGPRALFWLAGVLLWALAGSAAAADPAPRYGTITGVVINLANGSFLSRVTVEALPAGTTAVTDIDGLFSLSVPPGRYGLRVRHDGFLDQRVQGVVVSPGQTIFQDVGLNPLGLDLGSITVEAEAEQASQIALLIERKTALSIRDSIGREEISKSPGSDAADLMQRVTGVSVVDSKFVYVRGMGERYSNTMLNGAILPSTQPDKRVVSFDLFPTGLLENIRTEKSYTPDQPGEFSAGLVRMETVSFPRQAILRVSVGQGYGSNTTFKPFHTYSGGGRDWLGFDDGARSLPSVIPSERVFRRSAFGTSGFPAAELQEMGRAFGNVWEPRLRDARPNQKFSLTGGNTIGKLGFVFALSYDHGQHRQLEQRTTYAATAEGLVLKTNYGFDVNTMSVRSGLLGNLAYELNSGNRLILRNYLTRDTSDETRLYEGFSDTIGNDIRNTRLRFIEESIYSGQLAGEHLVGLKGGGFLEWRLTYSRTSRDEPDIREVFYQFNPVVNQFVLSDAGQSKSRQFYEMAEDMWEPAVDWSNFFNWSRFSGSVKVGASYRDRDRFFDARRFRFSQRSGVRDLDFSLPPETLLAPENINPNTFELIETTRNTDHYDARQITRGFYAMMDVTLGPRWRAVGGVRIESDTLAVTTYNPFLPDLQPLLSGLSNTDLLPAAGLIHSLGRNMNLRASYSRTVNRPEFRELAPFEFTDVVDGWDTAGNPDLERARIRNYDLRWEWFPSARELLSVSYFFKDFDQPIEGVIIPSANLRQTFANALGARNSGFEFETQKSLGFLSAKLDRFAVLANYTLVDSNVDIRPDPIIAVTSLSRPLAGQSRHIFNGTLEYQSPDSGMVARILFNYQGRRISDVGAKGQPDIFQESYPRLDAVFIRPLGRAWSLKAGADNLLDREVRYTQGDLPFRTFYTGRRFSIGVTYSFLGG